MACGGGDANHDTKRAGDTCITCDVVEDKQPKKKGDIYFVQEKTE